MMFSVDKILDLVCCPECKGRLDAQVTTEDSLGVWEGQLSCPVCSKAYPIREGMLHLLPGQHILAASKEWNLDNFDDAYSRLGNVKSNLEWARNIGIPKPIAEYDHPRIKGRLIEWLHPPDGGVVLDVGAGSGYFIFEMMRVCSKRADLSFVGVDPSAEYIKWLERRRREEGLSNVLTVVGDGRALPFQRDSFDVVVCSEVLEHIPDKEKAINEMATSLKEGGALLLSTPSKAAFDFWDFLSAPLRWALKTRRGVCYDRPIHAEQLREYLAGAGLSVERFEMNVILPPQSYFAHLPDFVASMATAVCGFLESHFKRQLASRFALHMVVYSRKVSGGKDPTPVSVAVDKLP